MRLLRTLLLSYSAFALASFAAANVTILAGPAAGSYATIQAAVDAAFDGDILQVSAGNYASFVTDDKALRIYGVNWQVAGTIEVRNLAVGKCALLSGLANTSTTGTTASVGLQLSNDHGYVRLQDCTLRGMTGYLVGCGTNVVPVDGGDAAIVAHCDHVSFAHCGFFGGQSDDMLCGPFSFGGFAGNGLSVASSTVALHGCTLRGGIGGFGDSLGGYGGTACSVVASAMFASGSSFQGGGGGGGLSQGGDGGNGLDASAAGQPVHLLDNTYGYGHGGGGSAHGYDGVRFVGSTLDFIASSARKLSCARTTFDSQALTLTITGEPGDVVFAALHRRAGWLFSALWHGAWLQPIVNVNTLQPLGVVPPSGTLVVPFQPRPCGPNQVARVDFVQLAVLDALGAKYVGEPATILVIDG